MDQKDVKRRDMEQKKTEELLIIREADRKTREEVLDRIGRQLGFPEHYGRNFDGLYDCLGEVCRPVRIRILRSGEDAGFFDTLTAVIRDAAADNAFLTLEETEEGIADPRRSAARAAAVTRGVLGQDKVSFLTTPTPLHRLDRISEDLGLEVYLKRDDLTDFGTGGNKLRKLEYFMKDALDQGATMLLTVGGAQTNHGRLTAAVAAKYGLKSAIVAVDPYPGELSANLLLDAIFDCHVYLVRRQAEAEDKGLLREAVDRIRAEWEARGERVYEIPMGGSNALGALGYYECALELDRQVRDMGLKNPHVYVTAGSLGTYTGLAAAFANEQIPMKLTGIGIMPYRDIRRSAARYFEEVRTAYGLEAELDPEDFDLITDYDFGAYNNPVPEVREAIYAMGRMEGIVLDPCYTGKTFHAIRAMAREGRIDRGETVIMIHTGGIPGIYTLHHRREMEAELAEHIHIL